MARGFLRDEFRRPYQNRPGDSQGSDLRNGSQQMGWPTYFQEIIIGAVIIAAVFLDRLRQAKRE